MMIFKSYQERSALLKVDYQDEEDLLLEKLEGFDIERQSESSSLASNIKIDAKDTLTKETVVKLSYGDFQVSVSETLRFRPPRASTSRPPKITINVV